jgi:UDP-N-acetylmuramoyl-tripeptide--D-alanyl-D-alanine ligase
VTHPLDLSFVLSGTSGVLRGELPAGFRFGRIERDAREVRPGDLFVAIHGERFDGHAFIADAAANGAAAALVRAKWADARAAPPLPLVVVPDDPIPALQRLAAAWRAALPNLKVVGITGSVGKTSAKEVAAAILGRRFRTFRSHGNLNNEIGLPLCLLEIAPDTEVAVLEMGGAYAFGDLLLLAGIARPDVGVLLNVHPVHLERMGTIEAIAETKAELVDALAGGGIAVLNGDDPRVAAMAPRAAGRVVTFGLGDGNEVRAAGIEDRGLDGSAFSLVIGGRTWPVETPMVGSHVPMLALSGLAVGHALGMTPEEMVPALADRAAQVRVRFLPGPGGAILIDDTYNASPPSVLSSLGVLAAHPAARRIAVLGEMRELGPESEAAHRQVGARAGEVADFVVTFGEGADPLAEAAAAIDGRRPRVASFGADERNGLTAFLLAELGAGDVVLLKGSRGLRMEEIVQRLQTHNLDHDLDRDGHAAESAAR